VVTGRAETVVTMDDVAELASALPEVTEGVRHGHRAWSVRAKTFAWERPLTKADIKRYGDQTPPSGPIVAVHAADLGEKEAILAAGTKGFFTMSHFNNYPAFLVQLDRVTKKALREALIDGWLACAPAALAEEYLKR
jgi:hypothetical protein